MANNPIQIVLNSGSFVDDVKVNPGGQNTDFFAERDVDFAAHKTGLITQFSAAKASLASSGRSTGIARVSLRTAAFAKSHRPTQSVLKPDVVPICGVSDFGELLIEFTPSALDAVIGKIGSAEPDTNLKLDKYGKVKANPSRTRSEVGAISKVTPYGPRDRRQFSVGEAIEWLRNPRSGQYFLIQMFVPTNESGQGEIRRRAEEIAVFKRSLRAIDPSLVLSEGPLWWSERGFLRLSMEKINFRPELFRSVLDVLENEPFVRKIWLPSIIKPTRTTSADAGSEECDAFPIPTNGGSYPVVGIVDTGIASIPELAPWVVGRTAMGDPATQDTSHGTFIGALIADSQTLNTHAEAAESPCKVYDLGLHVTDEQEYLQTYPNSFMDFLEQLDFEIVSAVAAGVRVFNMSLVVEEMVRDDAYSPFAARLDAIADKHDVVFVLPTGNLESPQFRPVWPTQADDALAMLANYRHPGLDRMHQPADSLRAVVVAALDPKTTPGGHLVPSVYSRRGPGLALGSKPDLCHLGGSADPTNRLKSLDITGRLVEDCGTSYAAPLVAKTLGQINHKIAGKVKRETLTALAIHGAAAPAHMTHRKLAHVAKDFVGFGLPDLSENTLLSDDHSITLVFEAELMHRKALTFDFQWPQALVRAGGKCSGEATLTLVYRPPLDLKYGSETVRVNLEAYLRQEKLDTRTGELSYGGFFTSKSTSGQEHGRVKEGQKWGAVKRWTRKTSKAGVGASSQFRLVVEPLARSGFALPAEGVPFAAILTITDPWGEAPVFNQMRRSLQARDVAIADIRTAAQIRPRVGG
ncbi:hypothetical protein AS189_18825 [Arthrobacter alpinus]|uniref:Peptidase S8/S53 domain-containing protein n=1 Tax=Arthrobacter alpinus TaxID=656366 RepID=A0A0S2M3U3_9MICC|nr:S8 family peptidase [Arthrobacter alpinus]ALO68176.1 hypothetical protein AS189_18825 [Arthrobacter alpinus]